ncbi:MAG: hypothetical protein AMXMBFR53_03950 [Gemmatimonadota bacterium]
MANKRAGTPEKIRGQLKKHLDEIYFEQHLPLDDFEPPAAPTVQIVGKVKRIGGNATVKLDGQFCLVILPKKVAKHYGMVDCNSDSDLCVWDPVHGDVHCTEGDN